MLSSCYCPFILQEEKSGFHSGVFVEDLLCKAAEDYTTFPKLILADLLHPLIRKIPRKTHPPQNEPLILLSTLTLRSSKNHEPTDTIFS